MRQPLRGLLKSHIKNKQLSNQQLERLSALQGKPRQIPKWVFGLAAMLVIIMGGFSMMLFQSSQFNQAIMKEIAYNHNKRMTPEIESQQLAKIQNYLAKLDFSLIAPNSISLDKYHLVGGRYCSIQGHLAAQLKIADKKSGEILTLYQVPVPEQLDNLKIPISQYIQGTQVTMWVEKGLLIGIAGNHFSDATR